MVRERVKAGDVRVGDVVSLHGQYREVTKVGPRYFGPRDRRVTLYAEDKPEGVDFGVNTTTSRLVEDKALEAEIRSESARREF